MTRIGASLVTAALLLGPGPAAARDFVASGQAGGLSGSQPLPSLPIAGTVSQTGSGPATLQIPSRLAQGTYDDFSVFSPASFFQATRMGSQYLQAGTFFSGGGPGNFSWCPRRANTANPNCAFAGNATGYGYIFMQYQRGPNQFGGAATVLRNASGSLVRTNGSTYNGFVVNRNQPNGGAPTCIGAGCTRPGPKGQPSPNTVGGIAYGTIYRQPAPPKYTYGPVLGPNGSIQTPGKLIGTGTSMAGTPLVTGTAFAFTTGSIVATYESGSYHSSVSFVFPEYQYWTISGYDNRTALGAGNIQLVAGGVGETTGALQNESFPVRYTLTMTLANDVPGLSPVGAATAAVLMIVAVGFAFRKRL